MNYIYSFLPHSNIKVLRGETEARGIYISCLSPNFKECYDEKGNYISPIFNLLMKEMFSELSKELEVRIDIVFEIIK